MDIRLKETLKIVGYYLFFGIWWIVFSDRILMLVVTKLEVYRKFQLYKSSLFIVITSIFLFQFIRKGYSTLDELNDKLQKTLEDLREKQIILEELAYIDHLTGLSSRRLIDEKYHILFESAKRTNTMLSLIMIDIDYFKKYNDKYGHLEGDKVLQEISTVIKKNFKREGDIIGRYGGEEFIVILHNTSNRDTINLVENLFKDLEEFPITHEGNPNEKVTISAGIHSRRIEKFDNKVDFLNLADIELYNAKRMGRNQYSIRK